MATIERTTALRLTDIRYNNNGGWESEQYEPLADGNYHGIQDNGGEPDGNAWLIWPVNILRDDVKAAIARGAEMVVGFEAEYMGREWKEYMDGNLTSGEEWSGIQAAEVAFFVDQTDAKMCAAFTEALRDLDDAEQAQLAATSIPATNGGGYAVEVR